MPKVTLSFTLPEEKHELLIAQRGIDFYGSLLNIQRVIREHYKYDKPIQEAFKEIEEIMCESETDDIP
jgi:hypothetical protein